MNTLELLQSLEGCKIVRREDGVIEIIPEVEAKEITKCNDFKAGDFIFCEAKEICKRWIAIFDGEIRSSRINIKAMYMSDSNDTHKLIIRDAYLCNQHDETLRHATEEEKQLLLNALYKERKIWNPETLQIEEDRAPRIGDKCVFWDEGRNTVIVSVLKDGYKGDEGQMIYETSEGYQHLECVRLQDFDFETMSAKHEK